MDEQDDRGRPPRSPLRMHTDDTGLLVVDVQERLMSVQPQAATIAWNTRRLLEGAEALGLPSAATEQSPEKLGTTLVELAEHVQWPILSKTSFSCATCRKLVDRWREAEIDRVLLCGIETHVCVQSTALDLIALGYQVFVAADAVGARHERDHETALRRLETSGALITTTESALFEWCADANHPAFKTISTLAKEEPPSG